MDERPDEPSDNPAQPNSACFEDGKILANDSHIAFVEVAERAGRRVTLYFCADVPADIPAFLDCYLSDTGQGAAVQGECRSVADDEYFRVVGYAQEWRDANAPSSIALGIQQLQDRRGRNPGSPQYRRAFNPPAGNDDALLVDLFDQRLGENPDAKPFEPPHRLPRQRFRKTREDALGTVE